MTHQGRPDLPTLERALEKMEAEEGHPCEISRRALEGVKDALGKMYEAQRVLLASVVEFPDEPSEEREDAVAEAEAKAEEQLNEVHARLHRAGKNVEMLGEPGRELVAATLREAGFGWTVKDD